MFGLFSLEGFTLADIWYGVFAILLTGYVILDGFDLGVGILHLFVKGDNNRRILLNAIGPVWDGNEVWLVTAGGALFAGFPKVYATICSGFYTPIICFLFALIFRACAIEFRSKQPNLMWRQFWDVMFSLASFLIVLLLGVLMGHFVRGVPLDTQGDVLRDRLELFHPYALLTGIGAVAVCAMHGSIFLLLKTEGELHTKCRNLAHGAMIFFIITYGMLTMTTLVYSDHMTSVFRAYPLLFVLPLLSMLALANVPRSISRGWDGFAFISSCGSIATLLGTYAIGIYPMLLRNLDDPMHSLTVYNSSSTDMSLSILLLFVAIGVPFVLAYTSMIYWIFRGKVKLDSMSY